MNARQVDAAHARRASGAARPRRPASAPHRSPPRDRARAAGVDACAPAPGGCTAARRSRRAACRACTTMRLTDSGSLLHAARKPATFVASTLPSPATATSAALWLATKTVSHRRMPARASARPADSRARRPRARRARLEPRRRARQRAARARDRHAAPAPCLRDDLERRAPVRGVAVADQRDRRAGLAGRHAELARRQRRPRPRAACRASSARRRASSGDGDRRSAAACGFTQRRAASREAAPKQRGRAARLGRRRDVAARSRSASGSRSSMPPYWLRACQ